jgi:four helix bundle protein
MDYQELEVWKKTNDLVKLVHYYSDKNPSSKQFGLMLQNSRAAISNPSNIDEGIERMHEKETIQFLHITGDSFMSLRNRF